MSLPGSKGVSMPSFMPIWTKVPALEGYIHTDRQKTFLLLVLLALRVTSCLFRLALRGYSVASLPWASHSHSQSIRSLGLRALRSHPQSLRSLKIEKKKCVSIDIKWSKTHKNAKKNFNPLTRFARSAASGEAQPHLPLRSLRSLACILSRFAPWASRSRFSLASLPRASRFALATYPMSLPGSQGVTMPSFMPIGQKLWALEGYIHTHTQSPSFII